METQRKQAASEQQKTKTKRPSLYHVIMLNDDFTPMDFVVWALQTYFDKGRQEAETLMLQVHHGNRAIVGTYIYDVATTKCNAVMKAAREQGFPFKVITEKAQD